MKQASEASVRTACVGLLRCGNVGNIVAWSSGSALLVDLKYNVAAFLPYSKVEAFFGKFELHLQARIPQV